jgi:hypothetical protein
MTKFEIKNIPLILLVLTACLPLQPRAVPLTPSPTSRERFVRETIVSGLPVDQTTTLSNLEQVDEYPLYTMTYVGDYNDVTSDHEPDKNLFLNQGTNWQSWSCSIFAALGRPDRLLFGRNFDWKYSPALILFTDPPYGNASVSMVDIDYLIDNLQNARELMKLNLDERRGLLKAPYLSFDGMNEHGLAIGMAAVPAGHAPSQSSKRSIGSLRVIREVLDHASNVSEAIDIIMGSDVDFSGGPELHYLIADANSQSAVVEYYQGEMVVKYNQKLWHLATNFILASEDEPTSGRCWRYDILDRALNEVDGKLDFNGAFELLSDVSQSNTQWSVIYGLNTGVIEVVMGRDYGDIHEFKLDLGSR